jgi:hypothetical protein
MNQDKLSKRVDFLRKEKDKSRRTSSLDECKDVWIDEVDDVSPNLSKKKGLQINI